MTSDDIRFIEEYMDWTYYPDDVAMAGTEGHYSWPSLDAVHEIEMSLTDDQMGEYLLRMNEIYRWDAIVADADQRLEQLLQILKN